MRIAQLAPLAEAVPPRLYGGTERVVHHLTEELVRRGHDVTLFASGDSVTAARLVAGSPTGLRLAEGVLDPMVHTVAQLGAAAGEALAGSFDLIHNHLDYIAYPFLSALGPAQPHLTTLHGRLDLPDLPALYRAFPRVPVVSISDAQRVFLPQLRWLDTVHHGLPVGRFPFSARPGDYLAFLGRINGEKRPDRAIAVARALGVPLRIAAKVDPVDRAYHEREIAPLIDGDLVRYVGEVDEAAKGEFLAGALALLFPIDWPEPFGLTMVEAMATGTPVVAMRHGSVPEVVADGVAGFVCDSVEELIAAVDRVPRLDRHRVREWAAARFSVERMADGYEAVYAALLRERGRAPSVMPAPDRAAGLAPRARAVGEAARRPALSEEPVGLTGGDADGPGGDA